MIRSHCIVVALTLAVLAGCSTSHDSTKAAAPSKASTVIVPVEPAARAPVSNELTLTAEFHPHQEVDVMAKVSGYLKKITVDTGDRVTEGQLLAELEVPEMRDEMAKLTAQADRLRAEIARAQQEVERSRTANDLAQLSYSRLAAVTKSKPGLVAQQEIDVARNRSLITQSQISSAQSALSAAEQTLKMNEAEIARAHTIEAYTKVTAPFGGVVTKRYADPGAMIQAGISSHTQAMPVVRISQTHVLRLVLPVPESAVPRLRTGALIGVRVPALDREFQGRVARSTGKIQTATRTMDTEVDVPNPSGLLVPGMFAEARLTLAENLSALSVPIGAVEEESGHKSVMVVTGGGKIELRHVETGLENADRVEIRKGLAEGELVVTGSRGLLKPGQKVEPRPTKSSAKGSI